jgi:hypothetical protein
MGFLSRGHGEKRRAGANNLEPAGAGADLH